MKSGNLQVRNKLRSKTIAKEKYQTIEYDERRTYGDRRMRYRSSIAKPEPMSLRWRYGLVVFDRRGRYSAVTQLLRMSQMVVQKASSAGVTACLQLVSQAQLSVLPVSCVLEGQAMSCQILKRYESLSKACVHHMPHQKVSNFHRHVMWVDA